MHLNFEAPAKDRVKNAQYACYQPVLLSIHDGGNSLQFKEGFFSDFLKQILDFLII